MPSQADRILACLERGGWWTCAELLREVPCIVHSRISSLRIERDYLIEHEQTGRGAAGSRYRLVSPLRGRGDASVEPVATVGLRPQAPLPRSERGTPPPSSVPRPLLAEPEQLQLGAAA